ncbi:MAG: flavin reductase family protein [Novosphingobium sp.]
MKESRPISLDQFRAGMQQLAAGVSVITTNHEGDRAGLTATAVCSLSAEPARLLVSVNRAGYTFGLIAASRRLCVNILSSGQSDIAMLFASPAPNGAEDRFATGEWRTDATGAPVLGGALVTFDCRVGSIIDTGSHGVVIADIVHSDVDPDLSPLLYARGKFAQLADLA